MSPTTSSMRFGVTLRPLVQGKAAWVDDVRRAEAAGFSTVSVMDHLATGGVWPALVAAHDAAPSLRVGTLVLNNDLWHPLLLAREAVTADILTDGAVELGLGAGWDLDDYRAIGRVREPASVRVARLAEALEILRGACSGERPGFAGTHYTGDGPDAWPSPSQARIPILVGGGGRRVLELAARTADIVSISRNLQRGMSGSWNRDAVGHDGSAARMDERIGWIRAAAGERFGGLELHAIVGKAIVSRDRDRDAAVLGEPLGLTAGEILASPHFLVGTVEEMAADLAARAERWGIRYWTLSSGNAPGGNDMTRFAEVIGRLTA